MHRGEVAPWATCGHREGQSKAEPAVAGTWTGMGVDVECCTHGCTRFFPAAKRGGRCPLGIQLVAVEVTWAFAAGVTFVLLKALDATLGLRVSLEEEQMGLDLSQHNEAGYSML